MTETKNKDSNGKQTKGREKITTRVDMISSMDSVRRREIRSRLLGQEAKNSEWWKQRTIAIFKKHINNFVVMTDLVPCRWNVPILQTHPFISAGLGNEEGEVPPGRAKLEVRW